MALNVAPVHFDSVSLVTAVPSVALGTERIESDGSKYIYVYNAGGAATGVGVGMSRPVSAAAGLYSGSVSSVSGDWCIGFVKNATIPAAEYGWALIRGLVTVAISSSASSQSAGPKMLGAAGLIATSSTDGFKVGELTTAIVSGNSGALYVNLPS
jgi:hypothetical protein